MPGASAAPVRPIAVHSERLWPPVWLAGLVLSVLATLAWAVGAALGPVIGWVVMLVGALLLGWLVAVGTPEITVTATELRAGRARVPLRFVGRARPLDATHTARLRTRDADPRAYLVLRGWLPTTVLVEIVDGDDPTPYWQLSSRRPEQLAAAITAARAAQRGR